MVDLAVVTVCSAGAASPVAEETDAGEADSTTKVASMCGLWSAGVAALVSAYPLVFCCVHHFLYPCCVGSGYFPTSCGQLQGPPRTLHRYRAPSCPCIAAGSLLCC